jgi:1-deoxy-D-xylulose-5-phosphate synthase
MDPQVAVAGGGREWTYPITSVGPTGRRSPRLGGRGSEGEQRARWSVTLLESVHGPADLKRMDHDELGVLAAEIREFLVDKVCRTGGHLGPNLGVVELTLALHRVFDSPRDALLFDVGHQSYVHKMVTGRHTGFDGLRQRDGLAGYPARTESEHDHIENSHASTALSYADGLAKAFQLAGGGRHAVAGAAERPSPVGVSWVA